MNANNLHKQPSILLSSLISRCVVFLLSKLNLLTGLIKKEDIFDDWLTFFFKEHCLHPTCTTKKWWIDKHWQCLPGRMQDKLNPHWHCSFFFQFFIGRSFKENCFWYRWQPIMLPHSNEVGSNLIRVFHRNLKRSEREARQK